MGKITGQTKDRGFQIGIRKTLPVSFDTAWDFLFSDEGLKIWLGKINLGKLELNKSYTTKEGTEIKITILKPYSHVRLTWKPKHWENISALQMRVINSKGKTTISFHQDKLSDSAQREEMKKHWDTVLENISDKLK